MSTSGGLGSLDPNVRHAYLDVALENRLQYFLRIISQRMKQIEHERFEENWRFTRRDDTELALAMVYQQNPPGMRERTDEQGGGIVIGKHTLGSIFFDDCKRNPGKFLLRMGQVFDKDILQKDGFIAAQTNAIQVVASHILFLQTTKPVLDPTRLESMRAYEKHIYLLRLFREEKVYYESILDKHILASVQYPALAEQRIRILNELNTIQLFARMQIH